MLLDVSFSRLIAAIGMQFLLRPWQVSVLIPSTFPSVFKKMDQTTYLMSISLSILAKIYPEEITPLLPHTSGEKIVEDPTCYFLQILLKYMVIQVSLHVTDLLVSISELACVFTCCTVCKQDCFKTVLRYSYQSSKQLFMSVLKRMHV